MSDHTHDHEYLHQHNIPHDHDHCHSGHGHTHSPEHIKRVSNRLARAIGHLESVKKMVEDGRDCSEVLIQLAAVKSAINNTGKVILKDHLEHCIVDAVEHHDHSAIEDLNRAIEQFMKFEMPSNELIYKLIEKIEIDKNKNIEVFFKIDIKKYVDFVIENGSVNNIK